MMDPHRSLRVHLPPFSVLEKKNLPFHMTFYIYILFFCYMLDLVLSSVMQVCVPTSWITRCNLYLCMYLVKLNISGRMCPTCVLTP
jgi:hypothetical protein